MLMLMQKVFVVTILSLVFIIFMRTKGCQIYVVDIFRATEAKAKQMSEKTLMAQLQ